MATRNLSIRLATEGGAKVREDFERIGERGQRALGRIENASRPASKGLLALNTAGREGQQVMRGYASRLGVVGDALGSIGPGGIAAAAGITALVGSAAALVKVATDSADVGDQFDKMAARTSLTVETLSNLAFAADRSGGSIGAVESSLIRLQRRQAAAVGSTSEQARAFQTLGVEIQNADGTLRGAEELFYDIADAVQRMGESSETTNAVTRVLGREAASLIPLLKGGAEGIRELYEENRRLGGEMSTEFAAAAATYKDRLRDMEGAFSGLKLTIGEELLPVLTDVVDDITDFATDPKVRDGLKAYAEFFGAMAEAGVAIGGAAAKAGKVVKDSIEAYQTEPGRIAAAITGGAVVGAPFGPHGAAVGALAGGTYGIGDYLTRLLVDALSQSGVDATTGTAGGAVGPAQPQELNFHPRPSLPLSDRPDRLDAELLAAAGVNRRPSLPLGDPNVTRPLTPLADRGFERATEELQKMAAETDVVTIAVEDLNKLLEDHQSRLDNSADRQRDLNRIYDGAAGIASRLAPEMQGFFSAFASFAKGDAIGGAINAVHGLLDVVGLSRDRHEEYLRSINRTTAALQAASQEVLSFARSMGTETAAELLSFQREALEPIRRTFENLRRVNPDQTLTQQLGDFFFELEQVQSVFTSFGGSAIENVRLFENQIAAALGNSPFALSLIETGTGVVDFVEQLFAAFGEDITLQEAGRQIFTVSDALDDLNRASDSAAKAIERQVSATFDVQEIAIREAAIGGFSGSDPVQRARVFAELEGTIAELVAAEKEASRRARAEGSDGAGASTEPAGGGSAGGTPIDVGKAVQLPGPDDRIDVAWSDIIDISEMIRPRQWSEVVYLEYGLPKHYRDWSDAIHMRTSTLRDFWINRWSQIVLLESESGPVSKHYRDWSDAVHMRTSTLRDFMVNRWSQIVLLENEGGPVSKHYRDWSDAIHMRTSTLRDFWINRWSQLVLLESESGPVSKHYRDWSDAIEMQTSDLGDFGINRWSQIVRLDRKSGPVSKHYRDWSDALKLNPMLVSLDDAVRIDFFGSPLALDFQELYQRGAVYVASKARLRLSQILDIENDIDFRRMIASAVSSEVQRRRLRGGELATGG